MRCIDDCGGCGACFGGEPEDIIPAPECPDCLEPVYEHDGYTACGCGVTELQEDPFVAALDDLFRAASQESRRVYLGGDYDAEDLVQDAALSWLECDSQSYDQTRAPPAAYMRRRMRWIALGRVKRYSRLADRMSLLELEQAEAMRLDHEALRQRRAAEDAPRLAASALADALPDIRPGDREAIVRSELLGELSAVLAGERGRHPAQISRARKRGMRELRDLLATDTRALEALGEGES